MKVSIYLRGLPLTFWICAYITVILPSLGQAQTMTMQELIEISNTVRRLDDVTKEAQTFALSRFSARENEIKSKALVRKANLERSQMSYNEFKTKIERLTEKRKTDVDALILNCKK